MKKQSLLLSFLLILLFAVAGQAQRKDIMLVEGIPEQNDIFNASVWGIFQDDRGDYWFSTNGEGLYHYKDSKLNHYTTEDGLVDNSIRVIQGDHKGQVFFDTPNGVSMYNGSVISVLEPTDAPDNDWRYAPDDLWFKTDGGYNEVFRYNGDKLESLRLPRQNLANLIDADFSNQNFGPFGVYDLFIDCDGNLWIGTLTGGVFRYDGKDFLWFSDKELLTLEDGRVPGVRAIIEDKNGDFWLSNMLHRYRIIHNKNGSTSYKKLPGIVPTSNKPYPQLPYFMSAVLDDTDQDLWMLTYSEGVWRYDGENLTNYKVMNGDKELLLYTMYKDNLGQILVGTHEDGVYIFDGSNFKKFKL